MVAQVKKDKEKVIGEVISDDKVREFLTAVPYDDENADFHILTKAYRGLPPEGFARFIDVFVAEGGDINGVDSRGQTFLQAIKRYKRQPSYAEILEQAGAH